MQEGIVRGSGLRLRKTLKSGAVVKELRKNSKVTILGTETWHRVRTRDGQEGYVFADFVDLDHASEPSAASGVGTLSVVRYQNPRFIGEVANVDADFVASLNRVAGFAKRREGPRLRRGLRGDARQPRGGSRRIVRRRASRPRAARGRASPRRGRRRGVQGGAVAHGGGASDWRAPIATGDGAGRGPR